MNEPPKKVHQQEDASSVPTTPRLINNPPQSDTSESPCLQMLSVTLVSSLRETHRTSSSTRITSPQLGGKQRYLHADTVRTLKAAVMECPSSSANAQKHYPSLCSSRERDTLLRIDILLPGSVPSKPCASEPGYSCREGTSLLPNHVLVVES